MFKKLSFIFLVLFLTSTVPAQYEKLMSNNSCELCGRWTLEKVVGMTYLPLDAGVDWYEQKVRTVIIKTEGNKYKISIQNGPDDAVLDLNYFINEEGETNESPFRIYDSSKNSPFPGYQKYASKTKFEKTELNSLSRIKLDIYGFKFAVTREVNWSLSKDKQYLVERIRLEKDKTRGKWETGQSWNQIERISFERKYKLVL